MSTLSCWAIVSVYDPSDNFKLTKRSRYSLPGIKFDVLNVLKPADETVEENRQYPPPT
ncbi:MAG: hypothetical protein ACPLZF_04815 [Nitrososphaeria archaeon]